MRPLPRSRRSPPATNAAQLIEIGGATILNDCYNSNPEALSSMIRTLAARPASRRILVAGEMLDRASRAPHCTLPADEPQPRQGSTWWLA